MRSHLFIMVQAITVLTVLKMLTNAQTTCNQGLGRVMYERLPDQQLQGFDDDLVRDKAPPFRVLEQCQELCLRDRTATNNLVRACTSFDFQPGSRIASFSGTVEYEESTCYLTREQAHPEGIGNLVLVPNSVHYTEVCLTSSRIERECPSRHYVFERHTRKKLKLAVSDIKEVIAVNRTDCEDRCLNEFNFVCRSATYDATARTCWLSRFTRRSHPQLLEDDPNSDYLENTCLNAERRCDGPIIFVKEENKRLGGPFEVDIYTNLSLIECQAQCLRAEKYFCRSIEYDEQIKRCIIFEEDSLSQKDDLRISSSPTHDLYDLVCLDSPKGSEFPDTGGTSHLFADGRRPDTAFQRYRNSRLGGEFHSEITGRSLSECLDECLRQASFQCRSAVYSDRFRICRLSRFNQRDGHRIIYDADYDYYENLMNYYLDGDRDGPSTGGVVTGGTPTHVFRPDSFGQDTTYHNQGPAVPGGGGGGGGHFPPSPYYPNPPGGGAPGGHLPIPPGPPSYWGPPPGHGPPDNYVPGGVGGVGPPGGFGNSIIPGGGPGGFYGPHFPGDPGKPFISRCDDGDTFKQVGIRLRARRQFIRRFLNVPSLSICEKACAENQEFACRSFNFKAAPSVGFAPQKENCELSDHDSRDLNLNNPSFFETNGDYDFYERSPGRGLGGDCLDVNQVCNEDGMEFTLRTPEPFIGRIYTYGYYDRCFYRGNGGTANVLRISGAQGYPDCGTLRYGDVMTNIVVVQFSDFVQTGRDKRYNLTCLLRGPGEAVVTSSYMTANSGSPIPIEYLPAENSLSSRVRLLILFQGRPTNTIAVGDPLTFRLEAQDGYNYATDIFATNVIARDPYSGRSVQLIDRYGCPVDNYVFPGLDRSREGDGLEARFNAFKIPESNFLVFEATVRTCREGCTPAYCTGHSGKSEPSLGRKRREVTPEPPPVNVTSDSEEHVREMIEVFESRYEMPQQQRVEGFDSSVCLTNKEYYVLVMSLAVIFISLAVLIVYWSVCYRRKWALMKKNIATDNTSPHFMDRRPNNVFSVLMPSTSNQFLNARAPRCMMDIPVRNARPFEDPSEPIYTDPSLFERSRSLRSIAVHQDEQDVAASIKDL
ncbi:PAN_AP [Nesidiocoris tenuis]|uniref:PAN_AP n=1 Tax=Nesidiocoris tenuis TaxID=355587 RepID=A0ABN7AFI6_9HEMI|nr:PAN_AP [Nesidiocoris tenuis]